MIGKPTRLLSGLALCVAPLSAIAEEPTTSRSYPPTYTERVTPWYDPMGWYRKIENSLTRSEPAVDTARPPITPLTPAITSTITPAMPTEGMIRSNPEIGKPGAPAWSWYGYGTVTPYQNPLAPQGEYRPVPPEWHARTGTTPGAVPQAGMGFPTQPTTLVNSKTEMPAKKPASESVPAKDTAEIDGIKAPATERKPSVSDLVDVPKSREDEKEFPAVLIPPSITPAVPVANPKTEAETDATPAARLRIPQQNNNDELTPTPSANAGAGAVNAGANLRTPAKSAPIENKTPAPAQEQPITKPAPTQDQLRSPAPATPVERPDGTALPSTNTDSPDLPVDPAPGIVIPGGSGSMSRLSRAPYTARGQQPDALGDTIRRTAGDVVREVRSNGPNAIIVVLKPGNIDAAWHAREQLAKMPELRRMTVTFEFGSR